MTTSSSSHSHATTALDAAIAAETWSDAWLAVEGSETGAAIHDLTITGNVQPLASGSLAKVTSCTAVVGP